MTTSEKPDQSRFVWSPDDISVDGAASSGEVAGAVDIQHGLAEVGEVLNAAVQMIAALPGGDALSPDVNAAIAKASDLLTKAAAAIEVAEESVASEGDEDGTDDEPAAGGDAEPTAPPKDEPKPAPARSARTAAVVAAGARRGK